MNDMARKYDQQDFLKTELQSELEYKLLQLRANMA